MVCLVGSHLLSTILRYNILKARTVETRIKSNIVVSDVKEISLSDHFLVLLC